MIDRADLLTWEGIRALSQGEVLTAPDHTVAILRTNLQRPIIKQGVVDPTPQVPFRPEPGSILFARTAWRAPWRVPLLKKLSTPVVLIGAFYDPMVKPQAVLEMFPPDSPVKHWFGVQAATAHPQFTAMPMGVEGSMVPYLQQAERRELRDITLYLNFKLHERYTHINAMRRTLWQHFSAQPWVTTDGWSPDGAAHYAQQLGRSRFVLSPPGNGWDCYRTYEAIAMGAITIVKRERPMTDVCEDLPVILVDDWYDITPVRLAREWKFRRGETSREQTMTMTQRYWTRRIQAEAVRVAEECAVWQ